MTGGEGGTVPISVCNNKRQSLGPEWSMSEVGNPPPHNLDKPYRVVASNNNNNKCEGQYWRIVYIIQGKENIQEI